MPAQPQYEVLRNGQKPISCGQIAIRLGRNPVSISRAIKRLRIKAALTLDPGGFKFYDEAAVTKIENGMRAKNSNGANGQ